MAGMVGDEFAFTIRGLIWALGRQRLVSDKPESFKLENKKCFLELKLMSAYTQQERILGFIDSFEKSNADSPQLDNGAGGPRKKGVYMRIFVKGILQVMNSFSNDLKQIEKSLLLDPLGTPVASLASAQLMHDTYLAIYTIIHQIKDRSLRGCQLLDICRDAAIKSSITITNKLNILMKCLHKQMMMQIKSWTLYGELVDPHDEFFIRSAGITPVQHQGPLSERKFSMLQQGSLDVSLSNDVYTSLIASTSTPLPFNTATQESAPEDIDKCYSINTEMMPSFLPYSLVLKILNLGKFMMQIKLNQSTKVPVSFITVKLSDYGIDKCQIRSMFMELEDGESFHHHTMEKVIDLIWCQMNKYMKTVAEDQGDLYTHHRNITDVFLMGRGELFRHFLEKASHLLLNDAIKVNSRSLDLTLVRVAQDLYRTDEVTFLKRFQFTLPPRGETPPGRSVLSVMKLVYKFPWPLPLIYYQAVMDTYNSIFTFLLNLKRAHHALTQAWNDITSIKNEMLRRAGNDLHFRLTSLVTNLQSYIFIDVILAESDGFQGIIKASDSFEQITKAHAKFLYNIVVRLFIPADNVCSLSDQPEFKSHAGLVHKELLNFFSLVHEFSMAVRIIAINPKVGQTMFTDLNKKFDSLTIGLISLVKRLNEKYYSEYLCTLIMRLDFNEYYTNLHDI